MKNIISQGSSEGYPRPFENSEVNGNPVILESLIPAYTQTQKSHVFIHPHDYGSDYTDAQLHACEGRDFETRLFITASRCLGDTVFLRTRHTDNHKHNSQFNLVRDFLKSKML